MNRVERELMTSLQQLPLEEYQRRIALGMDARHALKITLVANLAGLRGLIIASRRVDGVSFADSEFEAFFRQICLDEPSQTASSEVH